MADSSSMQPPSAKRQRLDHPVVSVDSSERPVYRVGRTEAVRFHKPSRAWRVGRLVQVVTTTTCPHAAPQYKLAFEGGHSETVSEKQFTKGVLLNQVGVGTRISVYWKERNCHYQANVIKLRDCSREAWYVAYEFGEREWINLAKTTFTIVSQPDGFVHSHHHHSDNNMAAADESLSLHSESMSWTEEDEKNDIETFASVHLVRRKKSLSQHIAQAKAKEVAAAAKLVHLTKRPAPALSDVSTSEVQPLVDTTTTSASTPQEPQLVFWGMPDNVRDVEKGCQIALWWPGERSAVVGSVAAMRKDGTFRVDVDRGQREWVDLRKYRFKILVTADGTEVVRHDNEERDETLHEPQGESDVERITVGSKISIFWASMDEFRDCTVIDRKNDGRTKPYWLHYSNGDKEWINFDRMLWKFQPEQQSAAETRPTDIESLRPTPPSFNSTKPCSSGSSSMIETIFEKDAAAFVDPEKEHHAGPIWSNDKPLDDLLNRGSLGHDSEPSVGAITASPSPPSEAFSCDDLDVLVKEELLVDAENHRAKSSDQAMSKASGEPHAAKPERKPRGRPPKQKVEDVSAPAKRKYTRESKEQPASLRSDAVEEVAVGSRVKIWQEADNLWTNVMVTNIRLGFGALTHQVEYENGESVWLDFGSLTFRFLRGSKRKTEEADDSSDEAEAIEPEDNELEILPGSKIRILDPSANSHFVATIIRYRRDGREEPYYIKLENGKREWTGFQNRSFRFCPGSKRCHCPIRKTKLYIFPRIDVGTRLHIWWDSQGRWFGATVTKIKPDRERPHFLEYEDGDKEWLDLQRKRFIVHTSTGCPDQGKRNGKKKANNKRARANSFDSESGLENAYSDNEIDWLAEGTPVPPSGSKSDDDAQRRVKKQKSKKHTEIPSADDSPRMRASRDTSLRGAKLEKDIPQQDRLRRSPTESLTSTRKDSDRSLSETKQTSTKHQSVVVSKVKGQKYHEPTTEKEARKLAATLREGTRVAVWWDGEDAYFSGTITLVREGKRPFCLEYDDGDREWVDLVKERFRILQK